MVLPGGRLPRAILVLALALPAFPAAAQPGRASSRPAQERQEVQDSQRNELRAQAFRARQNGEFGTAGDLFLKLSKLVPTDPELLLQAGECYEKARRFNDALDTLETGRKRFPDELKFRIGIARCLNLKGHHTLNTTGKFDNFVLFTLQDAMRECEAVLVQHPGSRDIRLILAQTLYTLNELDRCRAQCEELVKRFPDHPGAYILLGNLTTADYVKKLQATRQQGADTSKEAMLQVTEARDKAKACYLKALALDPERTVAHRKLGDLHAWNGDLAAALTEYRTALEQDPGDGVSHTWISQNVDAGRRFDFYRTAAEAHLQRPSHDRKKAALLNWYAASALYEQKKWKPAEDLYLEVVAADPDRADCYYWAMWAALQAESDDRAALHAARYCSVAPIHFADKLRARETGEATRKAVLDKLERWAFKCYQNSLFGPARDMNHVLAAVKDTAEAWNNYAFLCRETKMYRESYQAYKHAMEVAPEDGQVMNDAAVILDFHLGTVAQLREAEQVHNRLMKTRRMFAYEAPPMDEASLRKRARDNLEQAAKMYEQAEQLADKALKGKVLPKEDVTRLRTARRDARNNLRRLTARLKGQ